MKKIALLIAPLLLLSACGPTVSASTSEEPVTSTSETTPDEEESTSTTEEEKPDDTGTSEDPDPIVKSVLVSFQGIAESAGYNYGQNPGILASYFTESGLLVSHEVESVYAQACDPAKEDVRLTVGSSKREGYWHLELTESVKTLKVYGTDYFNFYGSGDYTGVNHSDAAIEVNGQTAEWTHVDGEVAPEEEALVFDFETATTSIDISSFASPTGTNAGPRFFLNALEFVLA